MSSPARSSSAGVVVPLFTAVVVGITCNAIVFAGITWRFSDREPAGELAVT
jgi:hypothetical protein